MKDSFIYWYLTALLFLAGIFLGHEICMMKTDVIIMKHQRDVKHCFDALMGESIYEVPRRNK
jgi:hypothetical protein